MRYFLLDMILKYIKIEINISITYPFVSFDTKDNFMTSTRGILDGTLSELYKISKLKGITIPTLASRSDIVKILISDPKKKKKILRHLKKIRGTFFEYKEAKDIFEKLGYEVDLRNYLNMYDWTGIDQFKNEILDTLPVRKNPNSFKRMEKRQYEYVSDSRDDDITSEDIQITLDEFRNEINNSSFIESFTKSTKDLINAKIQRYKIISKTFSIEYENIKRKVARLKENGTTDSTIKDLYPMYDFIGAFLLDIEDIIILLSSKVSVIDAKTIKSNLKDVIENPIDGLASLIGRDDIKNFIVRMLYSFSKGYGTFFRTFNNIVIYGPAGAGKTMIAKVIGYIFSKVGILGREFVKIVTRVEIVAQYIGQTAPRMRAVLVQTFEGILFIDEAYQLSQDDDNNKDFGREAVTEMVNFLDKFIGLNIVIVAGYEKPMKGFMRSNDGLSRRFPHRFILEPYSTTELTDILISNLIQYFDSTMDYFAHSLFQGTLNIGTISFDQDIYNFLYSLIEDNKDTFRNQAGDMLNLATSMATSITTAYKIRWDNENVDTAKLILRKGFDMWRESNPFL